MTDTAAPPSSWPDLCRPSTWFFSKTVVLTIVAILLIAPTAARARALGDSGVAYSADRALRVNGQRLDGVLYATPGFQRHEQIMSGISQVAIFDLAAGRGYYIVPSVRTYIDFPIDIAVRELGMPDVLAAPVGTERQGGVVTTKYRVDHRTSDGAQVVGFVWLAASGIPMRGEGAVIEANGKRTPVTWTLSNVHVAPQDPGLFQPPQGFYRLPAAALPGILGGAGN